MQSKSLATGTEFPTILVPKPQLASNRVPLRESLCRLVSKPKVEEAPPRSLRGYAWPQRRDLGTNTHGGTSLRSWSKSARRWTCYSRYSQLK